ncbi:hypothetical protein DMH02_002070 [Streptomyces sp. WAC 00631]|uniref:hypothetical protein n=1 Tax=Streptomyces sp. WAC 00631 TaxID=2203201 RepID=UPI000F7AD9FB|nr:hypothetical protein [Streptomyces sp. WAC 00631]MCC5032079.1 hypothetical protein [Streptomyces sp. WAC 00631]
MTLFTSVWRRGPRRAAALLSCAVLTACGGGNGTTDGAAADDAAPRARESSAAPSPVPAPPEPRGPELRFSAKKTAGYPFMARVVSARVTPDIPPRVPFAVPARSGTTYVEVVVKLRAAEAGRRTIAPPAGVWLVEYPACDKGRVAGERIVACMSAEVTDGFYTEQTMAYQGMEGAYDVEPSGTMLRADTSYYTRFWQIVPEDADLGDSRLCVSHTQPRICVPLGEVEQSGA